MPRDEWNEIRWKRLEEQSKLTPEEKQQAAWGAIPESPVSRDPSPALVSEVAHLELTDPKAAQALLDSRFPPRPMPQRRITDPELLQEFHPNLKFPNQVK